MPRPCSVALRAASRSPREGAKALVDYNALREDLRSALGDQSCLHEVRQRLNSLNNVCLTALGEGLNAATEGDLTVDVHPVTTSIEAAAGNQEGELARFDVVRLALRR